MLKFLAIKIIYEFIYLSMLSWLKGYFISKWIFLLFFYNKKQNKLGANKKLEYNCLLIP